MSAPTFHQPLSRHLRDDGSVSLTAHVEGAMVGFTFHATQAAELRRVYELHGQDAPVSEAYEQGLFQGALGCQTRGVTGITRFGVDYAAPGHDRAGADTTGEEDCNG